MNLRTRIAGLVRRTAVTALILGVAAVGLIAGTAMDATAAYNVNYTATPPTGPTDPVWSTANVMPTYNAVPGAPDLNVDARYLWDGTNLYGRIMVTDNIHMNNGTTDKGNYWNQDIVEFYINAPNSLSTVFTTGTTQDSWCINNVGAALRSNSQLASTAAQAATQVTTWTDASFDPTGLYNTYNGGNYGIQCMWPWTAASASGGLSLGAAPTAGQLLRLGFGVSDDDTVGAAGQTHYVASANYAGNGLVNAGWNNPSTYGAAVLAAPVIPNPVVASVAYVNPTTVNVVYTINSAAATMDPATAGNVANYVLDGGASVAAAVLQADGRTVTLTTSSLVRGAAYHLAVSNVQDALGNVIAPNPTTLGFTTPPIILPALVSTTVLDASHVTVVFSKAVSAATANNSANYAIGGISVLSASLAADGVTVTLTTSTLTTNTAYTLVVNNVQDLDTPPNTILPGSAGTFVLSGFPTTGLYWWLKADAGVTLNGSNVSAWGDQSGNGWSANQATAASQPLYVASNPAVNGKPTVRFNGTSQYLATTNTAVPLTGKTDLTIFAVASSLVTTSTFTSAYGESNTMLHFLQNGGAWGNGQFNVVEQGVNVWYAAGTGHPTTKWTRAATSAWMVYDSVRDQNGAGVETLYVNGTAVATNPSTANAIINENGGVYVGAWASGSYWTGDIAEIIIYTRALSTAERQTVEQYLTAKYLVVLPAPTVAITAPTSPYTTGRGNAVNFTAAVTITNTAAVFSNILFYDGAALLGSGLPAGGGNYTFQWNTTGQALGLHTINAVVTDSAGSQGTSATVAINLIDATPPTIVSAASVGTTNINTVTVTFSKALAAGSATTLANYALNNGATVLDASLGAGNMTVTLTTSILAHSTGYTLTVNNIQDTATLPNTIAPNSTVSFTTAAAVPPTIVSAATVTGTNLNQVAVVFSKPVSAATAANLSNYTIAGVTVSAASLGADQKTVTLTISGLAYGTSYTLTVNNIQDLDTPPNTIAANSTKSFTTPPLVYPALVSVVAADSTHVTVSFSKPMSTNVTVAANYAISGGATVASATSVTSSSVSLTTSTLSVGTHYTLSVRNVMDAVGLTISPNPSTATFMLNTMLLQYTFPTATANGATGTAYDPTTVAPGLDTGVSMRIVGGTGLGSFMIDPEGAPTDPVLYFDPTNFTTLSAAITGDAYLQFSVQAPAGNALAVSRVEFDVARGGPATPRGWGVQTSVDGFGAAMTVVGSGTVDATLPAMTHATVNLSDGRFQNMTDTLVIRIYGYTPAVGDFLCFDNITLYGAMVPATGVPAVAITSPTGTPTVTMGNSLPLVATASTTVPGASIASVRFFEGTTLLGAGVYDAPSNTWTCAWNTAGLTSGIHYITAKALDNNGTAAVSMPPTAINVYVILPMVAITSPTGTSTTMGATVNFVATASTSAPGASIASVQFYADSSLVGSGVKDSGSGTWTFAWNTSYYSSGDHYVTAVATDTLGASATSTPAVDVTLSVIYPTVTITSPTGTPSVAAGKPVTLVAVASSTNSAATISYVEFYDDTTGDYVGEGAVNPKDGTWTCAWDTTGATVGLHGIGAEVYDSFGTYGYTTADTMINIIDSTPPTIVSVGAADQVHALVVFSKPMSATATNVANYAISGGIKVSSVVSASSSSVTLTTSPLVLGTLYTLTVSNVQDVLGLTISPNPTVTSLSFSTVLLKYTFESLAATTINPGLDTSVSPTLVEGPGWYDFYADDSEGTTTDPVLLMEPNNLASVTASITGGSYIQFSLKPQPVDQVDFTRMEFDISRGGATDPRGWAIQTSVDGFGATMPVVATATISTVTPAMQHFTVDLSAAKFQNLTGTITLRLYGYTPTSGNYLIIDNLTLYGAVVLLGGPPSVAITSPASGATVNMGSPTPLVATASTTVVGNSIVSVQFFDGATVMGYGVYDTPSSSWVFNWNTTGAAAGIHNITAKATDALGFSSTSSPATAVNVNIVVPQVAITSPTSSSTAIMGTKVTLVATASTTNPGGSIASVQFYDGATLRGAGVYDAASGTWTMVWNTLGAAAGNHSFTAKATDNLGTQATSSPAVVNVVIVYPTVAITSPTGTFTAMMGGTINFTATASTTKVGGAIASVKFYNGATYLGTASAIGGGVYSYAWDTTGFSGSCSITATAVDDVGTSATSSPPTVITVPATGVVTVVCLYNATSWSLFALDQTAGSDGISFISAKVGNVLTADNVSPETDSYLGDGTHTILGKYGFASSQQANEISAGTFEIICGQNPNDLQNNKKYFLKHIGQQTVTYTNTERNGSVTVNVIAPYPMTLGQFTGYFVPIAQGSLDSGAVPTVVPYVGGATAAGNVVDAGLKTTRAVPAQMLVMPWPVPTVAITSPTGTPTVSSGNSVTLVATASASTYAGTISSIQLYDGATLLGSSDFDSASGAWTYAWSTPGAASGFHSITAVATDNFNNTATSAPAVVRIDIAPTVSITTPTSGTTAIQSTTLAVTATASDVDGSVTAVEFFDGATKLGSGTFSGGVWTWGWNTTGAALGLHSLSAKATDDAGLAGTSAAVSVTLASSATPPTVTLTAPATGLIAGQGWQIALTASTTAGSPGTVTGVEFFFDSIMLRVQGLEVTPSFWTYNFDTTPLVLGTHTLWARVTDSGGLQGTSDIVSIEMRLPGDGNGDNTVDGKDYGVWQNGYGHAASFMTGDYNGDGSVDGQDYGVWQNNYGRSAGLSDVVAATTGQDAASTAMAPVPVGSGPRLIAVTPASGVVASGVTSIGLVFDSDVQASAGAVEVSGLMTGEHQDYTAAYDAATRALTLTWRAPLPADAYTVRVVAEFVVGAVGGSPLDGETGNPAAATLPSGDGTAGGDARLEFTAE